MQNQEVSEAERHQREEQGEKRDLVTVTINNIDVKIHRGNYTVAKLKEALGVELSQELDQIINGQLKPLSDDNHVVIKGHEVFVSHARTGASS